MKGRVGLVTLLIAAGSLCAWATPSGWKTDFSTEFAKFPGASRSMLVALVDTKDSFACRVWKRNVIDTEYWQEWVKERENGNPVLVWCDRAEMSDSKWTKVAVTLNGGAPSGGTSGGDTSNGDDSNGDDLTDYASDTQKSLSLPLVMIITPDGRATRMLSDDDIEDADGFIGWIDEIMKPWEDVPIGTLKWPTLYGGVVGAQKWSLDYDGTRNRAFEQRKPVLVALVDSKNSAAGSGWVRGTLMTDIWKEWLTGVDLYLVMWDRAKIAHSKWDKVAFQFASGESGLSLPQAVLFNQDGRKVDQFKLINGSEGNLAMADDFIERLEDKLEDMEGVWRGPGTIGFALANEEVPFGVTNITVVVKRTRCSGEGAQSVTVTTHDGSASNGVHYLGVTNTLKWANCDSAEKFFKIRLLTTNAFAIGEALKFKITLDKDAAATAKVETTNLVVTLKNNFNYDTNNWTYDSSSSTWQSSGGSGLFPYGDFSWKAPQAGLLKFDMRFENTNLVLSAAIQRGGGITNVLALPISVQRTIALPAEGKVKWSTTKNGDGGAAFIKLSEWTPVATPQLLTPTNKTTFAVTNPPTLEWSAAEIGTNYLLYGKATTLGSVVTNAASPQAAVGLGLTNRVNYWRVDSVFAGDLGTIVTNSAKTWSFEINKKHLPPKSLNLTAYAKMPLAVDLTSALGGEFGDEFNLLAQSLPAGLSFNSVNGVLQGVLQRAGTYQVLLMLKHYWGAVPIPLTINVLKKLPDFVTGTFQGALLYPDGSTRGMLTLKVSSSGVPKLTLTGVDGRKQSLKGVWQAGGFTVQFTTKSGEVINLRLSESGVVFDGLSGVLERTQTQPLLARNYYTMPLLAEVVESGALENEPAGFGFLTFSVGARNGSVKYAGRLPDGTAFSGSTWLLPSGADGTFYLLKPLYGKRGVVTAQVGLDASYAWLESGGVSYPGKNRATTADSFSATLSGEGARFDKPLDVSPLFYATLQADTRSTTLLPVNRRLKVDKESGFKFNVKTASGVFSGSFIDEESRKRAFTGILVPHYGYGAGYWLWLDPSTGNLRLKRSLPVEIE